MSLKSHTGGSPAPANEYFYSWWNDADPNAADPGKMPIFIGTWAELPHGSPRTPAQIDAWDAATVVHGTTNTDAVPDTGYTIEMRFNLTPMGYDVTQAAGDVIEWNVSIYDCDYFWPLDGTKFSSNRTWWQSPWGNVGWYHEVRIYSRPDVTISSGPVPPIAPEYTIPNAAGFLPPTIDGVLTEPVWASAPSFDIKYGDDPLGGSYPGVARWRAGQYQPDVNGGQAFVVDPGDATVKYFFKEDTLYLGFDVRDQVVQYMTLQDRWDGFDVTINDRGAVNRDRVLEPRSLAFTVGPTGSEVLQGYLPYLRDTLGGARIRLQLKPGTTVDSIGAVPDVGYTAELAVDLTKLGYPHGLGDGLLFWGVTLYDGDSFALPTDSYGTRTWWYRERGGDVSSSWSFLDFGTGVVGVGDGDLPDPEVALLSNYPNPFRTATTLRFALPRTSRVTLDVFDLQGRNVDTRVLGVMQAGPRQFAYPGAGLGSGLFLYRLRLEDPETGVALSTLSGKMMRVK